MTPDERALFAKCLCPLSNPDAATHQKQLIERLESLTSMDSEAIKVAVPVDFLRQLEAYIWILHNEIEDLEPYLPTHCRNR